MSSSSDEEETANQTRRVGNSFAGFSLDSDSDDDSDDSSSSSNSGDGKQGEAQEAVPRKQQGVAAQKLSESDSEDEGSFTDSEDEGDVQKDEMSEFSNLVGRSTRHGTPIQADFVDAIQQLVGGSSKRSTKPTEIQCECWTTMLSPSTDDRDVIAISKTGSGKTLAFLVPLLASLSTTTTATKHSDANSNDTFFVSPRAIILAPTRVLAQQIFEVASTLVTNTPSLHNVTVSVALGGSAYHQQIANLLAESPDVIIATPGRLNSLCGHVAATETNIDDTQHQNNNDSNNGEKIAMCIKLDKVCELVVDEADMMLALGFQEALSWFARLVNHETASTGGGFRLVLTSATWDDKTSANLSQFESMSEQDPVFLSTGEGAGQVVTKNVTQRVEVLAHKGAPRFKRLLKLLTDALLGDESGGCNRYIVFCLHKAQARQMGKDLRAKGSIENVVLEGDMSQSARVAAIEAFRNASQGRRVLVATDVAARGLDVLSVSHVFNYSLGISIESYIHRCGRTGRAGRFGIAHTFVVKGVDEKLSPELYVILQKANQFISDDLRIMASKELKKRSRGAVAPKYDEDTADLEEARRLNREKQRLHKSQRGSKKSGRGRR